MKLIKAYIRPELLEDVYSALRKEGCCRTVFRGEETGRFSDPEYQHGSLEFPAMHTRVVKIEIAAKEHNTKPIIKIINKYARTGRKRDGMVFIPPIEQAEQIRDGQKGSEVLVQHELQYHQ